MNAKTAHIIEVIASLIPPILTFCIFGGFAIRYSADPEVAFGAIVIGALTVAAIAGQTYDMIRDSRYNYYRKTGQTRKADRLYR